MSSFFETHTNFSLNLFKSDKNYDGQLYIYARSNDETRSVGWTIPVIPGRKQTIFQIISAAMANRDTEEYFFSSLGHMLKVTPEEFKTMKIESEEDVKSLSEDARSVETLINMHFSKSGFVTAKMYEVIRNEAGEIVDFKEDESFASEAVDGQLSSIKSLLLDPDDVPQDQKQLADEILTSRIIVGSAEKHQVH